jgi:hypothetical protein
MAEELGLPAMNFSWRRLLDSWTLFALAVLFVGFAVGLFEEGSPLWGRL